MYTITLWVRLVVVLENMWYRAVVLFMTVFTIIVILWFCSYLDCLVSGGWLRNCIYVLIPYFISALMHSCLENVCIHVLTAYYISGWPFTLLIKSISMEWFNTTSTGKQWLQQQNEWHLNKIAENSACSHHKGEMPTCCITVWTRFTWFQSVAYQIYESGWPLQQLILRRVFTTSKVMSLHCQLYCLCITL